VTDQIIITCIQEQLNHSTLTVRIAGKPVARVLQDGAHAWKVMPYPQPEDEAIYPSLTAAVDMLVRKHVSTGQADVQEEDGTA
jgi:hypothetical protein